MTSSSARYYQTNYVTLVQARPLITTTLYVSVGERDRQDALLKVNRVKLPYHCSTLY